MASISLCMIVRDEEDVLGRCLESAGELVDEIIIVDTGSKDKTKEKALQYTDKIYDYSWQDDFSAARNFSLAKGTKDFLMWLDADDVISADDAGKFKRLKETLESDTDMVMMPYITAFDESGKAVFSYYRERIFRNRRGFAFRGRVHEAVTPAGKIVYWDAAVEHRKVHPGNSTRNLRIYENMELSGEYFDSRSLYYYGRELIGHKKYEKAIRILEEFLGREDAWVENRIDATRRLADAWYAKDNDKNALKVLLKALEYDVPRGETCCCLGRHFQERGQYEQAVYWYTQALAAKKNMMSGAFIEEDCYGFLPAISLCVCHDRMGDLEQAEYYNEMAGKFRPDSPYYLQNREYFRGVKDKQNQNTHI